MSQNKKTRILIFLILILQPVRSEENCSKDEFKEEIENCDLSFKNEKILNAFGSSCPLITRQSDLPGQVPADNDRFPTVGSKKVMGRLGNHIWGVMMNVAYSMKFGITMVMFQETKGYLKKYFKGFDDCPSLEEHYCGAADFFEHFRTYLDSKIEDFYSEKSGHKVNFERVGIQLSVPPEYGLTWKLNYKDLIDTENFIRNYKPVRFKTPDCPYEWEIFRGDSEELEEDFWKFGRALLLHPGHPKFDDNEIMESIPGFEKTFFSMLQFHDKFVVAANTVLEDVKRRHLSKLKTNKTSKNSKIDDKDFIFVGIHARGTDHIKYETDRGIVPLKTAYFLDAMHMFRQHFKKASKAGRLVFLYVSDDMEAGKAKLEHRNRDRDLYFVGNGLVEEVDSIGRDLSILAHCNHTIESHGSYSYFGGALSGGFRIVPQHFRQFVGQGESWLQDPFQHPLGRIYSTGVKKPEAK